MNKFYIKMCLFFGSILLLMILSTIFYKMPPSEHKEINFERIFMHEPGVFSILIKIDDSNFCLKRLPYSENYKFIQDGTMRVIIDEQPFDRSAVLKIYLKNINLIEGAGWNHGKFGNGTTIPIG